jgi:peptidoglycan/LPS O-acetylase OafA/YrhL
MKSGQLVKKLIMRINYRADIDGIRAIAVLLVIGFHYLPHFFRGGFVGVDIFFVISGFLISSIIFSELAENKFSFAGFYSRRIIRIFPALLLVLLFFIVLGWFVLLAREYKDLGIHVFGGTVFISNLLLWNEVGYFDPISENKLFLNLWSLGIEEQFYIFWPILMALAWRLRFNILNILLLITLISFATTIYYVFLNHDVPAAFYSPLSRAWELLIGAVLAVPKDRYYVWLSGYSIKNKLSNWCSLKSENHWAKYAAQCISLADINSIIGLTLIILSGFGVSEKTQYQWYWSTLAVAGVMLLIRAGEKAVVNRIFLCRHLLVSIGLISYPMYLWHWPILTFFKFTFGKQLSAPVLFLAVLTSTIFALGTYLYLEKPVKSAVLVVGKKKVTLYLVFVALLIAFFGLYIHINDGFVSRFKKFEIYNDVPINHSPMSNLACKSKYGYLFGNDFSYKRDFCLVSQHGSENVLIIGDSHASKLYDALLKMEYQNLTHIGRGSCAPIGNLMPSDNWLKCQPLIDNMLKFSLKGNHELIVLTGAFNRYFNGEYHLPYTSDELELRVESYFRELGGAKKDILIVLDNPTLPFDPSDCTKKPIDLRRKHDCFFPRSQYEQDTNRYRSLFFKSAKRYKNIKILDQTSIFCDLSNCYANNEYGLLYTGDKNHLSLRGAMLVSHKIVELYPYIFKH